MKFPKQIYVYICDYRNDEPVYVVAVSLSEIPEDMHGEKVSLYSLGGTYKLKVAKTILAERRASRRR
jgi:hypothetical protein